MRALRGGAGEAHRQALHEVLLEPTPALALGEAIQGDQRCRLQHGVLARGLRSVRTGGDGVSEVLHLDFKGYPLPSTQADVKQWRVRYDDRDKWHTRVWELVLESGNRPKEPWTEAGVICTRYSSGVEPDRQNLGYSFKALLDGLKLARVIADDKPEVLLIERYLFERVEHRIDHKLTVTVGPAKEIWKFARASVEPCHHCGAFVDI